MLLGLISSGLLSLSTPPTYAAKSQLFVSTQSSGTVTDLQQGNSFSQARVQSYVKTATTPEVLQPAIDSLGVDATPAELSSTVSATADPNTVLISITAEDSSPVQAAAIAQAVAESLITAVDRLETPAQGRESLVRLSIITPATAPSSPTAPNTVLNLLCGLVVGAALGLGWAVFRTRFDTKLRGEQDLRRVTALPFLGGVAFDSDAQKKPLLTQASHQSPRAESFRQIRTNLQFANVNSKSKLMLVTSSLPAEGKSTTAINLAIAMAQAGQRVVLVDADLRRPTAADYLGLEGRAGLTTALIGAASVEDLLQPWGDDELYVLTSGQIPPNPSELLGSGSMSRLLGQLELEFDVVIIDAPPLIPVTDASVLAQMVGGVVLVVGANKVKTQDLEKSIGSLNLVGANVVGIVLNLLPTKGPDAYAHSYYSYGSKTEAGDQEQSRRAVKSMNASHMRVERRPRIRDTAFYDATTRSKA
ncbi:polysaccharide biosynthesis tyrosine autokinase [Arthrobacter sp. zg-Y859]|uniref:Polysaccharide biosynthesis tyrosine autokinase n=1 Tax=Arthrobacter jinronghuae TaxID=2964609 RepID=A0ABT1NU03_9MICC|nr:polysaccharide biosynthesis tyrosine autokinase [Arthrobacter jinronghuae]